MELVYLWVEEYKNIKNQGFNFSPRFTCQYDKAKNELTIEEKKDCISIFPPNINITAIVGENGSGKSSILECIFNLLNTTAYIDQYIFVYKCNNTTYLYTNINILMNNLINMTKIQQPLFKEHSDLIAMYLNNVDNEFNKNVLKESNHLFLENNTTTASYNNKIILSNLLKSQKQQFRNESDKFFIPDTVQVRINFHKLKEDEKEDYSEENLEEIKNLQKEFEENLNLSNQQKALRNIITIMNVKQKKFIPRGTNFQAFSFRNSNFHNNTPYFTNKYACKLESSHEMIKTLENKKFSSPIFYEWKVEELTEDLINFICDFPELVFEIILLDKTKIFNNLSYGEKQLLIQLNKILYYSQNQMPSSYNILIMLDEFEVGLHPNWQKKAINYIADFLKNKDNKFNIVLTSHSPFILSDLPKENVIFLERGKQVYPNIETFGANIHTLLSHGFFMKDGLMGEFAKSKINEVIDYLNGKKSPITDDDEAQRYIHIIGEPIVKRQLQRMLDSKKLDKMKEIDALKNQIKSLQSRLENLEKKS